MADIHGYPNLDSTNPKHHGLPPMRIASWNVNSVRTRLDQVLAWLEQQQPDVLCLQETKVADELFPHKAFEQLGYHCAISGQKAYNGVALVSRLPMDDVQ
ncbi:MAG: exodeoxyribonuclease, partial [Cyanobacteriota bacterium]